ncbi:MAG: sn-glycerol-3-phosphate ABC transporter ATP-binding protein UgpC [Rhizobiaceae bacterium]|nr:sn-glycerol-3-phosphate ABC transporter ATP-binding protein UgpC [Rhizobiaceae bacterium]
MASLTIDNVVKRFGAQTIIRGVSFDIADGELVILVGPSGCGKSTLLRMIAGLETLDGGAIRIGERVVNDLQPKDRDIAMVFQSYALYPHMTVADNMSFALRMAGADKAARDAAVQRAASILSLEQLLDRYPRQLSGGQRQRVAMGRAIVRDPAVFLFDEPLSNLDAKLRVQMRAEIKELHRRLGSTIVYVTHDQVEAMTLADRIVCLQGGTIAQIGTPNELYGKPANLFVAEFIGSPAMNILPGRLDVAGEAATLELADGVRWSLPAELSARWRAEGSRDVAVGIRPEHLREAPARFSVPVDLPVAMLEPLGSDTLVHAELAGRRVLARVPPESVDDAARRIALHVDLGHLHLFDRVTGKRLGD